MKTAFALLVLGSLAAADEIDDRIRELGSDDYATRRAAHEALVAIGDPALARLRVAACSADLEVATRAANAVEAIAPTPDSEGDGLGCRLTVEPARARVGDVVTVRLVLRNATDHAISYLPPIARSIGGLSTEGPDGWRSARFENSGQPWSEIDFEVASLAPGEILRREWRLRVGGIEGVQDEMWLSTWDYWASAPIQPGRNLIVFELVEGLEGWRGRLRREVDLTIE